MPRNPASTSPACMPMCKKNGFVYVELATRNVCRSSAHISSEWIDVRTPESDSASTMSSCVAHTLAREPSAAPPAPSAAPPAAPSAPAGSAADSAGDPLARPLSTSASPSMPPSSRNCSARVRKMRTCHASATAETASKTSWRKTSASDALIILQMPEKLATETDSMATSSRRGTGGSGLRCAVSGPSARRSSGTASSAPPSDDCRWNRRSARRERRPVAGTRRSALLVETGAGPAAGAPCASGDVDADAPAVDVGETADGAPSAASSPSSPAALAPDDAALRLFGRPGLREAMGVRRGASGLLRPPLNLAPSKTGSLLLASRIVFSTSLWPLTPRWIISCTAGWPWKSVSLRCTSTWATWPELSVSIIPTNVPAVSSSPPASRPCRNVDGVRLRTSFMDIEHMASRRGFAYRMRSLPTELVRSWMRTPNGQSTQKATHDAASSGTRSLSSETPHATQRPGTARSSAARGADDAACPFATRLAAAAERLSSPPRPTPAAARSPAAPCAPPPFSRPPRAAAKSAGTSPNASRHPSHNGMPGASENWGGAKTWRPRPVRFAS